MARHMRTYSVLGLALALGLVGAVWQSLEAVGPDAKKWDELVNKGVAYLRSTQASDGSWSKERSLGISGVVMTALLRSGKLPDNDRTIVNGLRFLESLVNPREGHIAGENPRDQLKNYVTSVNVMAFAEANKDGRYHKIVQDGARYLKMLQWDEGEEILPKNNFYGGAGYDSKSRPDLSNTQFFVDALKAAGVPQNDPAYQKVVIFVSRCQNLKSEYNDQPWAAKVNDGGFIYTCAGDPESKAADDLRSYGSMTYAGVKSLIYAGVSKDDKRVQAAWEWIRKNYTVDRNPGFPPGRDQLGLYYYYHTMAKCLDAMGVDYVEDAQGKKHDWRKDITEALAKRQRADGSWVNPADRWMEGDPNLVTAYALLALSYCKPKK